MKHLLICPEFPPASGGGIGTYGANLSALLAGAGEIVNVVAAVPGGPATSQPCPGVTVHGVPAATFSRSSAAVVERLVDAGEVDVIEVQEYDAPAWDYLERSDRSSRPPLIVHLHSPTELISLYNGRDLNRADVAQTIGRESECILAADWVLSPSHWLADWAESRYGLDRRRLSVIPYPLGEFPLCERSSATWERGSISFLGRLEPRKGGLEWLEAAADAAARRSSLRFGFAGRNVLGANRISSMRRLQERIPFGRLGSFCFHGHLSRPQYIDALISSRVAVVPSRWDNLPHTCLEAMASGLPVITTPNGGMAEIVEDGVSGWIADDCSPSGLVRALDRMLALQPSQVEEMGRSASRRVRELCGGSSILNGHLELCREVLSVGRVDRLEAVVESAGRDPLPEHALSPSPLGSALNSFFDLPFAAIWAARQCARPASRRGPARRPTD